MKCYSELKYFLLVFVLSPALRPLCWRRGFVSASCLWCFIAAPNSFINLSWTGWKSGAEQVFVRAHYVIIPSLCPLAICPCVVHLGLYSPVTVHIHPYMRLLITACHEGTFMLENLWPAVIWNLGTHNIPMASLSADRSHQRRCWTVGQDSGADRPSHTFISEYKVQIIISFTTSLIRYLTSLLTLIAPPHSGNTSQPVFMASLCSAWNLKLVRHWELPHSRYWSPALQAEIKLHHLHT